MNNLQRGTFRERVFIEIGNIVNERDVLKGPLFKLRVFFNSLFGFQCFYLYHWSSNLESEDLG